MGHDALVGAGGYWPVIDEKPDPAVVHQISDVSCVSACGEMLLKDRGVGNLSQADLLEQLHAPAPTLRLADVLNRLLGARQWRGAQLDAPAMGERRAIAILSNSGSWVAAMHEFGSKLDHAVVVDGIKDDDTVSVRDPFHATSYRMRVDDFLQYWTWTAVWQERP